MTTPENSRAEEDAQNAVSQGDNPLRADLPRRTILTGAAWAVPVVALAVATPLAAASVPEDDNTLVFDENLYIPGDDCTITGVRTTLTNASSAPVAGELVTVVLPAGYRFADNSTTKTLPTDASGGVTWPTIIASPGAGTFALNATTPTAAPATSEVTIVDEPTAFYFNARSGKTTKLSAVPANSKPLGGGYMQAPNGDIYYGNTRLVVGAGPAIGYPGAGQYFVDYTKDGVARTLSQGGFRSSYSHIPANAVPVGAGYFLQPNGRLWAFNVTTGPIATGVTSASGYTSPGGDYWIDFVNASGGHSKSHRSPTIYNVSDIPAGSTAVGAGYFLRPDRQLRYAAGNNSIFVSFNVHKASGYASQSASGGYWVDYVQGNGAVWETTMPGGGDIRLNRIPATATPIGGGYFLDGTTLYSYAGGGRRVPGGSNVSGAAGYESTGTSGYWADFVVNPSGCL